jgi:putative ABC transport system permease protein
MTALNRKLMREVWQHRGQMLSIAAVVATGILTVLTMRGTYESLIDAQERYYHATRFPDVWVQLKRAPESLVRRLRELPGVAAVDTRVTFSANLDVSGLDEPAHGRFVSIPARRRSMLGDLHLKSGRYISPAGRDEVLVSDKFAAANALAPGSTIDAVIRGRLRKLFIVGTAIAPEHSYAVPPGSIFPDDKRYGIVWMSRESLAPAYDMEGAFNEAVFTLAPGANLDHVLAGIDRLLEENGGLGAYDRDDQISHQIMKGELDQNRTMGIVIPLVFLAVATFLLNIVLARLITTQRTEIAALKAFGYTNLEIGLHYLRFSMAPVLLGVLGGTVLGIWIGGLSVELYGEYFAFPALTYIVNWTLVALAALVSIAAATAGALSAVRQATSLPPAEALRPAPPATFHAGILERMGLPKLLPSAGRMILRNIERQPIRSVFSAIGVGFSVAILVIGMFMFDSIDYMMDLQFRVAQGEDLSVTFNQPLSASVQYELSRLPGVSRVEPFRAVPVRLKAGHRQREVAVTGVTPEARLRRIVTADGLIQPLAPQGIVMSARLAEELAVTSGDTVLVEVLEGARRSAPVQIAGVVEDFLGLSAYMHIEALHRLTRGGRTFSGAFLAVDEPARSGLNLQLKHVPAVGGVSSPSQMLETFERQLADSLFIGIFFMVGFSGVIAVAVVYNGARIALSERQRELASLRVLGFSRNEVTRLLLGEQALVTFAAIPFGCLLGYGLAAALVAGLDTEAYRIPLVVSVWTYVWAGAVTTAAAFGSGWIVRRQLDQMDIVSVLKTRE